MGERGSPAFEGDALKERAAGAVRSDAPAGAAATDDTPGDGQIINSNSHLLESLVRSYGADPIVFPVARDSESQVRDVYRQAIDAADFVVSSGGVSVGDHDVVREVVKVVIGCGAEVIARHLRSYETADMVFDPMHFLPLLEQKVGHCLRMPPLPPIKG